MDRNRIWVIGAVLLIGVTGFLGWMLGISPKLSEAKAADEERVSVETQNVGYEAQVATLKTQFESIGELKSELATLQLAVPSAAEIPAFVKQLDAISQQHQVTLTDITVNDAQPYVPVVVAAPVAETAAPVASDAAAAAEAAPVVAPVAPTALDLGAALAPTPSPLVTAANFVSVPVSLTVDGSYGSVLDFLEGLQKGTRLVMVTTFSTTGAVAGPVGDATESAAPASSDQVTAKISGLLYVLLAPGAAAPTPAG